MGRRYAGVLGLIAFLTALARGWLGNGSFEGSLRYAIAAMLIFAGLGYVLGRLAEFIVEDSVRGRLADQLAAREAARSDIAS